MKIRDYFLKIRLISFIFILYGSADCSTGPEERLKAYEHHRKMHKNSIFRNLKWTNCGPFYLGGRVTDIEAYMDEPSKYYVATASGGVWITENNGGKWDCIFDIQSAITIGDIAISQSDKNLIWVGTGEANSSRSSYAGTGIFKSKNRGKTWVNMGLTDSHHIGRVLIDPKSNDIVYVAALGHLYSENIQRGVFKTTDGGRTWKKVLFINDRTGCIDMVMHPENSHILYASVWEKDRKAWSFIESGQESGIYKTLDGGKTWNKLTNGFPENRYLGRIGLAISYSNPSVIYALLDNQEPRPEKIKSGITIEMVEKMSIQCFLEIDNGRLELFLKENKAPIAYDVKMVKEFVRTGKITPRSIAKIFSDAQEQRLNPYVKGAEVYRSDNNGVSWEKVNKDYLENMYLTYGFYFGQIRVCPVNEKVVYILGIPILKSVDEGKTFENITGAKAGLGEEIVHRDSHALWINPRDTNRLILGTDGGLNLSTNGGATWEKISNLPVSQCYTIEYDFQKPFHIYCGLQDNGVVMGSSQCRYGNPGLKWKMIWGGDGAFVRIARKNHQLVFLESQFGFIHRLDFKKRIRKNIQPRSDKKKIAYRFNWLSPFLISLHESSTLLMGANLVLKSIDAGDNWSELSPDLSIKETIPGNIPYATITALDESPFTPDILVAGTDDGNIWVTKDSGKNWDKINHMLPKKWVSRVVMSRYDRDRIYVTMTGYREDDFKTYIYTTSNYGLDWLFMKANLPQEPVNVLREDPDRENILYLGTDLGVYVSLDRGEYWYSLKCNLPTVPVYDMKVHPRDKIMMIATHGRGVYLLSLEDIQKHDSNRE